MSAGAGSLRIDKWLWAARLFKTRSAATEAVLGGRVQLNGTRVKPAREVRVADTLEIRRGFTQWTVVVAGLAERRGSAEVAAGLYEETPESVAAREQRALERRLAPERADAMREALSLLADYPHPYHGRLAGLVECALRWHRVAPDVRAEVSALGGMAMPTRRPPVPLPEDPRIMFLATVGDVVEEGARMRHCVGAYARRAVTSQGIGWIFQFGMGYTFYLPFAIYIGGFLCWSYTVIKLLMMGRLAGYGLGLMFIAGYALMFSNLTLMVILGVMLLTLDRARPPVAESLQAANSPLLRSPERMIAEEA